MMPPRPSPAATTSTSASLLARERHHALVLKNNTKLAASNLKVISRQEDNAPKALQKAAKRNARPGQPLIERHLNLQKWPRRKILDEKHTVVKASVRVLILILDPVCMWCRKQPSTTVDHVRPVNRGGTNSLLNLVGACVPCNSIKSDFMPQELGWILRLPQRAFVLPAHLGRQYSTDIKPPKQTAPKKPQIPVTAVPVPPKKTQLTPYLIGDFVPPPPGERAAMIARKAHTERTAKLQIAAARFLPPGTVLEKPAVLDVEQWPYITVPKRNTKSVSKAASLAIRARDPICVWCAKEPTTVVGKVVPPSRGGNNTVANMVGSCHDCQVTKAEFLPRELGWTLHMSVRAFEL